MLPFKTVKIAPKRTLAIGAKIRVAMPREAFMVARGAPDAKHPSQKKIPPVHHTQRVRNVRCHPIYAIGVNTIMPAM